MNPENRKQGPIIMTIMGGGEGNGAASDVDMNAFTNPEGMDDGAGSSPPPPAPPAPPAGTEGAPVYTPDPIWNIFSEKLNAENKDLFKIPDAVRNGKFEEGRTELDYLIDSVKSLTAQQQAATQQQNPFETAPSFVKEYLAAASQENFNEDQFLQNKMQQKQYLNMSAEDFMRNEMKKEFGKTEQNPNGLTDEDINSRISGMKSSGLLELQAADRKNAIRQRQQAEEQAKSGDLSRIQEEAFNKFKNEQIQAAQQIIDKQKQTTNFYGLDFAPEEKSAFEQSFLEMVTPDKKTGLNKIHEYLLSDENLYKMAALIWKGDKGFRDGITSMKEDVKQNVLKRTGLAPNLTGGGGMTQSPNVIDVNSFLQPEQENQI